MKMKHTSIFIRIALATALTCGMMPMTFAPSEALAEASTLNGKIVVDGNSDDWENVPDLEKGCTERNIEGWKLARDAEGNVYLLAYGTASNQWDNDFQNSLLYLNQNTNGIQLASLQYIGATVSLKNNANGQTPGPFVCEAMIPSGKFADSGSSITFLGTTVAVSDIPVLDGKEPEEEEPTYQGIVIDGKFKDWAAVDKSPASCPNDQHKNCLEETAVVFDGDNVYIYLKEGAGGSASGAGSNGNGRYSITTDLGRTLNFQLKTDGSVSGPAGASAKHVGSQWEICIPADQLPPYLKTINFGLYLQDPFVKDIANLDGQGSGGSQAGITYDGSYEDWTYYPHTNIEYATAGTQVDTPDAEGALYAEGSTLYGHVVTTMPAHLGEQGGEFLAGVSIAFNGDKGYKEHPKDGNFYPQFFTKEASGNITVLDEGARLPEGTTEVYISDVRQGSSAKTYKELCDQGLVFGRMYITVSKGKNECEFELDLEKVGKYINQDPGSFKEIGIQWGKLGQQWVTISGVSTAPWLGVGLCLAAVAIVLVMRRRKRSGAAGADLESA